MKEFKGSCYNFERGLSEKLLFPLVQLKVFFSSLYQVILKVIWAELIKGEKIKNELTNLILFVLFCALSLLAGYLQNYIQLIIIIFLVIWWIDHFIAITNYFNLSPTITTDLKQAHNSPKLSYQLNLPQKAPIKLTFIDSEIKQINLIATEVKGGAFQETMGIHWQCFLLLYNNQILLLNEAKNPCEIFNQAQQIKETFNLKIPIIFKHSQGNNPYTEFNLESETIKPIKSIGKDLKSNKHHIYTKWTLKNSWQLLQQIISESGFFLFVIIMTNLMVKFSVLINWFLENFFTFQLPSLNINEDQLYNFQLPQLIWLELAIAILPIILKAWEVSKEEHFYIDKVNFKFFLNNRKISQFPITNIQTILLLNQPQIGLLILTSDQWLMVTDFPEKEQFLTILSQLEQSLSYFQSS